MPYDTTGKSHINGVSNEEMNIDILNRRSDIVYDIWPTMNGIPYIAKQLGGTKTVVDGFVTFYTPNGEVEFSLSMKNADQESSTHDWINCSSEVQGSHILWGTWAKKILSIRQNKNNLNYSQANISLKEGRQEVIANLVENPKEVVDFLQNKIVNRNLGKYVLRFSKKNKTLQVYKFDDHPMITMLNNMSIKFVGKPNAKSRMIRFEDQSGVEHDCGLRIRIDINNGVTALLGLNKGKVGANGKKKNNNSSGVIKIQQEKVEATVLSPLRSSGKLKTYKI